MKFPEQFKERYCKLVDDENAFLSIFDSYTPKSFRVNSIKANIDGIRKKFEGYGIPIHQMKWYDDAFVSENPEIGATLEHFLGEIYLQEIVSMLPPLIVRDEIEKAKFVLDGCAAPGSKTTQIAAIMKNQGTLIANDLSYSRIRALKFNIEKTGVINTIITNRDLLSFPNFHFDTVILDVPCSAEGTIRKNEEVLLTWSEREIEKKSRLQKSMITKGFDMLAPGKCMVYSTCTFAPEENEAVVSWLLKNRPEAKLEKIQINDFKLSHALESWENEEFESEITKTARIWPHENNTGGFYLAKIKKG